MKKIAFICENKKSKKRYLVGGIVWNNGEIEEIDADEGEEPLYFRDNDSFSDKWNLILIEDGQEARIY